ncbi:hypothetical protein LOZ53_000940 [Ophidiomyces ophidiicola]|uniref:Uncharacterized protein n=1 Tax=Ophidiomyces ophidiicola TaxID=1387563 RepID=A0ACB8V1T7_9EURO|nr:hypothetical protein LOZ64_003985 [Ophidiomyces ophidiicola]KAI1914697.1 hypothetical protein LOZ61_002098 [Ophidiomyces ophidiicola]KAI1930921.1 hypothetical protein LOZ60_000581 [Ophidiomyces ophidiicola]KAI1962111.1 hypothetical protein LOZ59_002145 [Ophidiomyces ophidiicola]KAI1970807.1 hypothetical protein LOZ56_003453 [Ophidiomyces ophidiicola]
MQRLSALVTLGVAILLLSKANAEPHGNENDSMKIHGATDPLHKPSTTGITVHAHAPGPLSYFVYGEHSGTIIAHIVVMVLAWVFILPIGVMFSIARSRLALPAQFIFLIVNALGVLVGIVYNGQTPDLYQNNAHHKVGWIATCVVIAQFVMGLLFAFPRRKSHGKGAAYERVSFIPNLHSFPPDNMEHRHQHRWSRDSGQGTERSSSSLHSQRSSSAGRGRRPVQDDEVEEFDEKQAKENKAGSIFERFFRGAALDKFLTFWIPGLLSQRCVNVLRVGFIIVERTILPFGFITIVTGAVTYGGILRGNNVFNGLAHFIKGGIFLWYGFLTLGRWLGSFADFGWAWNAKPTRDLVGWKANVPTGEFTESFVIFLYGASNVFLEHLAAWGGAWTAQDLEHVSISVMFFGGGLCGMLAESKCVRHWVNSSIVTAPIHPDQSSKIGEWQPPKTQELSLNPMPAIVILLLGLMMSSHHQASMVSTMVHAQWGMLLVGFSLARAITYVLLYLNPPTSFLPSRPPSELVASFCLISGGLIFMLSTKDIIDVMIHYDLNAMFVFTVAMGLTAFVMALEIVAISLKAWASKRTFVSSPQTFRFPE